MTINDISRETGVPATTIRYWDKVGIISTERCTENNYRMFTSKHIQEILTIYALKYTVNFDIHQYSIDKVKEELKEFDYNDTNRIVSIANDITNDLDKVNRAQIRSISVLYHLCTQVETNNFEKLL